MHAQFAHQIGAVGVDGLGADPQFLRRSLVGHAARNRLQHLQFARRQSAGLLGRHKYFLNRLRHYAAPLGHLKNTIANLVHRCRFQKNAVYPGALKLVQNARAAIAGDDNKARGHGPAARLKNDLESGGAGHRQIQNCTIGRQLFDQRQGGDAVCRTSDHLDTAARNQRLFKPGQRQGVIIGQHNTQQSLHHLTVQHSGIIARICVTLAVLLALAPAALAQTPTSCPVLDLTGSMRGDALTAHIAALEDTSRALTVADLTPPEAPDFTLLDGHFPDFGYTPAQIWLRMCLRNTTDTPDWRLYVHENFFQVFEVHIQRADGVVDPVESLRPDSPFSARVIPDAELVVPLNIEPGETVTLFLGYSSGGASQMDFSLETLDSFMLLASKRTAKNFIFYGMMLLLIALAMASLVVFRHVVFLAYSSYAAAALLFVMHGDGVAFQYLWPALPGLNSNASIFTGGALIVSGAAYARVFLQTRLRHPHIDKLLWGLIVATPLLIAVLIVPNSQLLKKLLIILSLGSILIFTGAGLFSYLSGHRDVRFYTLAWLGALVASGMMNLRHVVGLEIPQETVHDSIRVVMVLDAMMMGLAIADRYNQMRRGRQDALEQSLLATRQRLDLNRRLADLQARHDLAVLLAKSRDHDIQNVVHDLRQPLHALRLNVMNLTSEGPVQDTAGRTQNVDAAFTYLETLIAQHLESDASDGVEISGGQTHEQVQNQPGLQDILAAVADMFQPDAEAKELSLRYVASQSELPVSEPLVLTRILSNLVSNAIKYTDSGGVLIVTRRRGNTVRVEIHDTGPGMSNAEFAHAAQRNVRLEKSRGAAEGNGLGLAIAIDLANRHGMQIEPIATRRNGTGLALVLAG